MESTSRPQAEDLVKRYGGRVTGAVSGKTSFLVVGSDAGATKRDKAIENKVRIIDEDAFLDLIRTQPGKASEVPKDVPSFASIVAKLASPQKPAPASSSAAARSAPAASAPPVAPSRPAPTAAGAGLPSSATTPAAPAVPVVNDLWTEKYRPRTRKDLIGNPGHADKMFQWLRSWEERRGNGFKGKEEGMDKRAILLSGPPGIGKTSSAHVVAKEAGYEVVEFNASDTRSKKSLELHISDLIGNRTVSGMYRATDNPGAAPRPICLVMDEVDGMSSGDRGGVGELSKLIKKTKIPIICICNDASSPKMRGLANYCFSMRFRRPEARVIAAKLRTVAFRENLQLDQQSLEHLVEGTHADIRQVLNLLSTFRLTSASMTYDQAKDLMAKSMKNMTLGPFDVISKILTTESGEPSPSVDDQLNFYFHDFSLMPLMVQENYLRVNPNQASWASPRRQLDWLHRISRSADSIAEADLISRVVNQTQDYSLLPAHGVLSTVIPGSFMRGRFDGAIQFAGWLGKNSSATKMARLLRELNLHLSLKVSADRSQLRESYVPVLLDTLLRPLRKNGMDGVDEAIQWLDSYDLTREDIDNMIELTGSMRPPSADPWLNVSPQVKSQFTRRYNSGTHSLPYSLVRVAVTRGSGGTLEGGADPEAEDEPEPEPEEADDEDAVKDDDDDVASDRMIKAKKPTAAAARGGATTAGSSSGRGAGAAGSSRGSGAAGSSRGGRGRGRGVF